MKACTEADPPSLSKCVILAGLQYTPCLAPDKTVKHADRFPILAVCQASFLDMWMGLEEKWEAMLGNDERIDLSLLFPLFIPAEEDSLWALIGDLLCKLWGLLIAIAHERVLSFPSWWLQIKPKPISSAGWFLRWLNGPKSNNTCGLCQIPVPQCVCFPLCWKKKKVHRFREMS